MGLPHRLIIVRRDHAAILAAILHNPDRWPPGSAVMLDRRAPERRGPLPPGSTDQRPRERRAAPDTIWLQPAENGGPGAPAFLYVRRDLQARLVSPIWGWLGHATPFEFEPTYTPAPGIDRFLAGSPPVLSMATIEPAVDLLLEAGLERIRAKSVRQTEYLIGLWEAELAALGFALRSPRDPARRGSHVSLGHREGWRINRALIEEMRVLGDFREPDNLRLGVAPLYTTYTEIHEAVARIGPHARP